MGDDIALADLQHSAGSLAAIVFHNIEHSTQKTSSAIQGYYHLPHTGAEHGNSDDADEAAKYSKAFVKGHKVAVKVASLINHGRSTHLAPLRVMGSGLVGGPPCEGHARLTEGITWFEKTHFHHQPIKPEGNHFTATHYLHFSTPLAQIIPGAEGPTQPMDLVQEITLISGMCLWTSRIIQSSIPRGQRLDVSRLLSKITLYEVEYLSRAVPVIADLAAALSTNNLYQQIPLNIRLDIPSFHYYHSLEERLRDGRCSFLEALHWMHAVEKRHHQLSRVFCRLLDHELSRRQGVTPHHRKLDVQVSPLANLVYQLICDSLANNTFPSVDDILQILHTEDRTWADFYALVPVNEKVTDFRGLSYLFYVYQVLRPALEQSQINAKEKGDAKRKLLISIDDAFERRIYSRSQKFLKKLRASLPPSVAAPHLLEVYLCRRIFINSNEIGSNLYLDDPSPEPSVLRFCQRLDPEGKQQLVRAQDRHKSWPETVKLDAFDVVERLYGSHITGVLKELFAEVGLEP
ncbi:hypothetical protein BGW36DRAFT_452200 [Talaromyces proteolyticus]|uniref:Uncharacterized protein n=1 Tax=Talaromyces proteolyticus TaxID=1131652 RepID=A0AAD4KU05_9EURO|nr:uncharacterized protein BGW36DRAFT_452200 [Talaromyces proteolyticus]KAH8696536.1 hypothetical protein BGW36DRAFT_452200 [Talaromyces proteolyticus]